MAFEFQNSESEMMFPGLNCVKSAAWAGAASVTALKATTPAEIMTNAPTDAISRLSERRNPRRDICLKHKEENEGFAGREASGEPKLVQDFREIRYISGDS